jgi:Raf kinase inhibitor-like YbhB/YbcL family protein
MSTSRWLSITVLLACACPADDDGTTGNDTGSSSTAPTTTTTDPSSESTAPPTTTDISTSTTDAESSTAADESSTAADESSSSTTEPVAFEVTSTEFENDGPLPHTAHIDGGNESPDLAWVGAPAGTMSFGVYLHDLDFLGGNPDGFPHSAIWNIPSDVSMLPHDVDHDPMPADVPGAVQCENWTEQEYGYGGPGSPANHYEFVLFALDTADLSAEIDEGSTLEEVWAAFNAHSIGTATIVGQSTGP